MIVYKKSKQQKGIDQLSVANAHVIVKGQGSLKYVHRLTVMWQMLFQTATQLALGQTMRKTGRQQ